MTWSDLKTNGAFKFFRSALEAQRDLLHGDQQLKSFLDVLVMKKAASVRVDLYCEGHSEKVDELIKKTEPQDRCCLCRSNHKS